MMSTVPNLSEDVVQERMLQHRLTPEVDATHVKHAKMNDQPDANSVEIIVPWLLHDKPVENQRPIRVIVIGAGFSGVYCGIRIPERIRNCELIIYEKNAGIGGTWYGSPKAVFELHLTLQQV